ncbi:hypothetical protein SDC9_181589 [bioreactor metagenome]|uniref:Uncharacterized protein n=1 Tax=bioreactor metagenome TaxID=1076179 RepID=A0A645H6G7_9ZZZZ
MAAKNGFLLGKGEGQSRCHTQLLPHQIQPGDHFRNGMLHLNSCIHLYKIIIPVFIQHEFYGSRPFIAAGFCRPDGGLSHFPAQFCRQCLGWSFLHKLLIFSLNGALPLPQMDHVAQTVRHNLKFNMPGVQNQLFQV